MKAEILRIGFSVTHQGKRGAFYFQALYDRGYWQHHIFKLKAEGGIFTGTHLEYGPDLWRESKVAGVYLDVSFLGVRIGIYLHPLIYSVKR